LELDLITKPWVAGRSRSRLSRTIGTDQCKFAFRRGHYQRYPVVLGKSIVTDIAIYRTFLKRKGGLFKKAHELSVLCSVDVAVIIFGHNKKLYEFSSGDINETIGRYQYVSRVCYHRASHDISSRIGA
jgi:hypothetical protein